MKNKDVEEQKKIVLDKYYNILLLYRDKLEDKLISGKIDEYYTDKLIKKLNQWYENHQFYKELNK